MTHHHGVGVGACHASSIESQTSKDAELDQTASKDDRDECLGSTKQAHRCPNDRGKGLFL